MKLFIFKVLIFVAAVAVLGFACHWVLETYYPPMTSDVAVNQLQNSDAAYQSLKQSEMMKNSITTIYWFACFAIGLVLFYRNIRNVFGNVFGFRKVSE